MLSHITTDRDSVNFFPVLPLKNNSRNIWMLPRTSRKRENAINCTNALRSAAWFSANSSGRSQRQSAWLGATWTVWESGYVLRKFSLTTGNHSLTSFPSDSRCFFMKKNVDCETWKRYLYMTNVWREEAAWFFTWNKHWKEDLRIYDEEVD